MFTLAADGKTNGKGLPNPLRLAVIAREHFDTVRLPFPPVVVQRVGLAVGASVGRLLGYRERLERNRRDLGTGQKARPERSYERGRPHQA
jgi:hypothetical protein